MSDTGLSFLDILAELWLVVILGPESWVAWFILLTELESPFVASLCLSLFERSVVVKDVFINSEVWHEVINWVSLWCLWESLDALT